ncbi:hypothetical protein MHYP_G00117110 [Metynnis hypsauchen]
MELWLGRSQMQEVICLGGGGEMARVKTKVKVMKRVKMSSYYRQAIIKGTLLKRALRSYSGLMDRDVFQALFEELDKDRIQELPAVPRYSSRVLSTLQCFSSSKTFSDLTNTVALANIICIFLMALVASTVLDLVKNLRAFAGILVVGILYEFCYSCVLCFALLNP